ncbi:xanthine dehydrogenase/oxidase-like [Amphiura filiformis]|uniref:xanthine dehydrogenase/oxidase-like n=1 Tax=Amphiura filiformis TaxID=82378 RepID=UPI003B21FC1B
MVTDLSQWTKSTELIHGNSCFETVQLTGSKEGCGVGACGACTVMISSVDPDINTPDIHHLAVNACLYPVCAVHGKAVTTVEGIGSTRTKLHAVQERLAKAHGSQCGFCTPGMVMSMYTLLRNHPKPTNQQLLRAVEGNLCRCTGYRPILDAFKTFTKESCGDGCQCINGFTNGSTSPVHDRDSCGENSQCVNGRTNGSTSADHDQITSGLGNPKLFTEYDSSQDIIFPPEILTTKGEFLKTCWFRNGGVAWASIGCLEELLELKSKHPGAPIIAGNTALGVKKTVPLSGDFFPSRLKTNVAEDEVIVNISIPFTKKDEYINVYKVSRSNHVDTAIVNAAFRLQLDESTKTVQDICLVFGGVAATTKIATDTANRLIGKSIDPSKALAQPGVVDYVGAEDIPGETSINGEDIFALGKVEFYSQIIGGIIANTPDIARKAAKLVDVKFEDLPSIVSIKMSASKVLGEKANRIRCHVRRIGGAFGGKIYRIIPALACTVAARKCGKPVRLILSRTEDMSLTGTRQPTYYAEYKAGFTDTGVLQALRVKVYVDAGFTEGCIDYVATHILFNLDSVYSVANIHSTAICCKTNKATNTAFRGYGAPEAIHIIENVMYDIATVCQISQLQGMAMVTVYLDGTVLIHQSGIEMGQGIFTKMIQVASRVLGVPHDLVHCQETSTTTVPNQHGASASCTADRNGYAIKNACEIIKERLKPFKDANPKGSWTDWVMSAYQNRVNLTAIGFYKCADVTWSWVTKTGRPYMYPVYGTACSEVEVDCLTGNHQVLRTDIVIDIGRSMNPAIDIGQIEGAFMQGYGLFALEDHRYSPQGILLTNGPHAYKIPCFMDIPSEFNITLLRNSKTERAVYSSKGVAEPPVSLANSVFFAIKDAIQSARADVGLPGPFRLDSPATGERVRLACADSLVGKFPVAEPGTYTPWEAPL